VRARAVAGAALRVGAALVAGAPAAAAAAQQPPRPVPPPTTSAPAGPDSAARASIDSVRGAPDSLRTPPVRRDSIQPPLTRAELPVGVFAGPGWCFAAIRSSRRAR
jgi:hypothetical protein